MNLKPILTSLLMSNIKHDLVCKVCEYFAQYVVNENWKKDTFFLDLQWVSFFARERESLTELSWVGYFYLEFKKAVQQLVVEKKDENTVVFGDHWYFLLPTHIWKLEYSTSFAIKIIAMDCSWNRAAFWRLPRQCWIWQGYKLRSKHSFPMIIFYLLKYASKIHFTSSMCTFFLKCIFFLDQKSTKSLWNHYSF